MEKLQKEVQTLFEMIDEATTVEEKEYYQIRAYRLEKFMNQLMGNY